MLFSSMPMSSVSAQNEIESRDEERERGQWEQGTKKTLTITMYQAQCAA